MFLPIADKFITSLLILSILLFTPPLSEHDWFLSPPSIINDGPLSQPTTFSEVVSTSIPTFLIDLPTKNRTFREWFLVYILVWLFKCWLFSSISCYIVYMAVKFNLLLSYIVTLLLVNCKFWINCWVLASFNNEFIMKIS